MVKNNNNDNNTLHLSHSRVVINNKFKLNKMIEKMTRYSPRTTR
jgi:hypothetical protein